MLCILYRSNLRVGYAWHYNEIETVKPTPPQEVLGFTEFGPSFSGV